MAEAEQQNIPSLAEQWSLQSSEEKQVQVETPTEATGVAKPADATSDEAIPEKADETILVADAGAPTADEVSPNAPAADVVAPNADEVTPNADEGTHLSDEGSPFAEETAEAPEQEEAAAEDAEDKPEIKLETAPADFRFPTTNQSRHCFTRYVEYHRCIAAKGEDASECDKFAKYYRSLCPGEWVDRWNEQRENGTFPGPL